MREQLSQPVNGVQRQIGLGATVATFRALDGLGL